MTIDANLIEGLKLGIAIGVLLGMGLTVFGLWIVARLAQSPDERTLVSHLEPGGSERNGDRWKGRG